MAEAKTPMSDAALIEYVVFMSDDHQRRFSALYADAAPQDRKSRNKRTLEADVLNGNFVAELRQLLREAGRLS